jgi:hypothetical protein
MKTFKRERLTEESQFYSRRQYRKQLALLPEEIVGADQCTAGRVVGSGFFRHFG